MEPLFQVCLDHQNERIKLQGPNGNMPPQKHILLSEPEFYGEGVLGESAKEEQMKNDEQYYRGLGIETSWYRAKSSNHSSLQQAFEALANLQPKPIDYSWEPDA